jgi:hypothetical protein
LKRVELQTIQPAPAIFPDQVPDCKGGGNHPLPTALSAVTGGINTMQTFLGMILGALLLVVGVYLYDSMQTSEVASGQVAQTNRTIVNWDIAATDWNALKHRAHDDWVRISSK